MVIATQYPAEFEGNFPLSLSQLDAFILQVEMSLPSEADSRQFCCKVPQSL